MSVKTHILIPDEKLKELIEKTAEEAIQKILKAVSIQDVDIIFYRASRGVIEHLGFGGYTSTNHLVMVSIDLNFKNLEESIQENLPKTLAHELYHTLRKYSYETETRSLLNSFINEGLADHFEMEVFGGKPEKWDTALTKPQLKKFLKMSKKEWNNPDYDHYAWFFGNKEKNFPMWTGYSIGFYLVSEYLKNHPNQKPSNIYNLKTEEFVKRT